jgi:hypothetical protein
MSLAGLIFEMAQSTIELQIDRIGQLFETFDPMPFRERDLDRNAEEYIVEWARELPRHHHIQLRVHIPASEASHENIATVKDAFSRCFRYRADATAGSLRELFRTGRYSLLVGLLVLALCLAVGQFFGTLPVAQPFGTFIKEGLIILGWVANWRPIEIFLYDWWPIVRRRDLYRRLAAAKIEIAPR